MGYEDDSWREVWRSRTDSELEETLSQYLWLAANSPNHHQSRIRQLIEEAERRGKPEIIDRAKKKAGAI